MTETSFDSKRRLCPDGACIGVLGADGRCGECGRSSDGKPRVLAGGETPDAEPEMASVGDSGSDAATAEATGAEGNGGFDPNRRLCEDGSCVGVIGPDGRCGVCGHQAA